MAVTVYRLSNIFTVTTTPADASAARSHSGSWSEEFWLNIDPSIYAAVIQDVRVKRAALLPKQAAITGIRIATFSMDGNRLLPIGSSTGHILINGNAARETDIPQLALSLSIRGAGGLNFSRPVLRCMPDDQFKFGEYQPDRTYDVLVRNFVDAFGSSSVFGFVGRDKSQASVRVLAIVGGVLTTASAIVGFGNGDFIRLNRVIGDDGNPVKGTFSATSTAPGVYTLVGYDGPDVSRPSGTARRDRLAFFNNNGGTIGRATVKKIGRPSEPYRGKRSRVRG